MQMEFGLVKPVLYIKYGKYEGLTTTGGVASLWEGVWCKGVITEIIKLLLLSTQREEGKTLVDTIINTG